MSATVRLLIVLLAAASLMAAEARIADLVAVAELRPTAVDWRWDDQLGSREGNGRLDAATAAGLGVHWGWGSPGRPHLLTAGADLLWQRTTWDGAVIDGLLLRAGVGYARALTDRWLVQAGPELALGQQRFTRASAVSGDLAMQGSMLEAGFAAEVRCSLGTNWSLGAGVGWQLGRSRLSGDGATLELDQAGFRCGLTLAYSLDPQPRPLE